MKTMDAKKVEKSIARKEKALAKRMKLLVKKRGRGDGNDAIWLEGEVNRLRAEIGELKRMLPEPVPFRPGTFGGVPAGPLPDIVYSQMDCYNSEMPYPIPQCPSCSFYGYPHGLEGSIYWPTKVICNRCGCVYDPRDGRIFTKEWDRRQFRLHRENSEMLKESWKGRVDPVRFDQAYYRIHADYQNPEDRSRILSFKRKTRF